MAADETARALRALLTDALTALPPVRWQVSDASAAAAGDTAMTLFDPRTGAFLGGGTTYPRDRPGEYDGDAVVKLAVVDRPGQLP